MIWFITHLVPRIHWSSYSDTEGNNYLSIWRQWLGIVWKHTVVKV